MNDGCVDGQRPGKQFSVGFHFPSVKTSHKTGSVFGRTQLIPSGFGGTLPKCKNPWCHFGKWKCSHLRAFLFLEMLGNRSFFLFFFWVL